MARRTQRTTVKTTAKAPAPRREAKARSRKTEVVEAEVVEEEKGMGIGDGMVIATTLMLVAAILMTDWLLGQHYGGGIFFK